MIDARPPFPQIISAVIRQHPAVIPHLSPSTNAALKATGEYSAIRLNYFILTYQAVYEYLTSSRPVTSFRNAMSQAVVEAFGGAVDLGYQEGGAELPLDDDTLAWLNGEVDRELGFVSDLFSRLRDEFEGDPDTEATARAEGYANRLDAIYSEAKTRAAKNKMLTFNGDDGKESCPECKKMKGQRHRASWWIKHGLIPGPGNTNYTCNGYNCEHRLYDDDGNEWTE